MLYILSIYRSSHGNGWGMGWRFLSWWSGIHTVLNNRLQPDLVSLRAHFSSSRTFLFSAAGNGWIRGPNHNAMDRVNAVRSTVKDDKKNSQKMKKVMCYSNTVLWYLSLSGHEVLWHNIYIGIKWTAKIKPTTATVCTTSSSSGT